MSLAVEVHRLRRVYKGHRRTQQVVALDDVDLTVGRGQVHGLLGPNGAGKTTLVRILSTLLTPTSGQARVLGHDVVTSGRTVRSVVGVAFGGERGLYTTVSSRQNLEFWCAMYRVPRAVARDRIPKLLALVRLDERADEPVERLSRGMKQRLHLARALVHDPEVLFLDEPTAGLDPFAVNDFRHFVGRLKAEGRTVVITTHDMVEAEVLCDQISVIDKGRVVLAGAPAEVSRRLQTVDSVEFSTDEGDTALADTLRSMPGVESVEPTRMVRGWRVQPTDATALRQVLGLLVERGVVDLRTTRPSLEQVYLRTVEPARTPL